MLAQHLGIPSQILGSWRAFLAGFRRRFKVLNHIGDPHLSNVGSPEGCPLSVSAMALLSWCLHCYQTQFCPAVRTLSFVDNIILTADQAPAIAAAWFSLQALIGLWGMTLDSSKTYTWGTTKHTRRGVLPLAFSMVLDARELGGIMSFTKQRRNRLFAQRGTQQEDRWLRLRRSLALFAKKVAMLPMVFWPSILHGASSCSAVRALGVAHGGASPLIRLSISKQPTADPGYYQLFTRCTIFGASARNPHSCKSNGMPLKAQAPMPPWQDQFLTIGWQILVPPLFSDHDGFIHNLTLDLVALDSLLEEAWMQHVAERVRHRSTLSDLAGIDKFQTLQFDDKLTPLQLAQINCIREGSFISPWQQSRFDLTKHADCAVCNVPNTQLHWVECPKFAEHRLDQPEILTWLQTKPCSFMQHLLVPRSPYLKKYRQTLLQTPCSFEFYSKPTGGMQHIFTDGSCTRHAGGYSSTCSLGGRER